MATRVKPGTPSTVRPSGTVTFLFSDIEGSTARWERDRNAMSAALSRHDALVRTALEARGGYVFKTVGDAFCAAFFTAADAIAAALDAQRVLSAEDFSTVDGLRVRMALHTGTAEERDADYFGPTVNRVARLLAVGHGGQVLVSATTAALLRGELPLQTTLQDLGEHRLRDLAFAERVYQIVAPDLPQKFPALLSLDVLPNNLPLQLTSFVGREHAVAEIKSLIEAHRLVTLLGTGGAGKTRCAIQVGAELLDGSGNGVWLIELASISDPAFVVMAIAQVLNVQERPNRSLLESLVAYLKRKRLLLILDNCEHVIAAARTAVSTLLHACPEIRILATSREPLNVFGEATYRMPSLAVPDAVQLFVDRALLSNDRFTFTQENASYVGEICRRLDGIPLAIELAAARAKVLSPKQLAQKIDERFRVLTAGDRTVLPRHQTMRALIDWSYDLLSSDERALFRMLSIFAGGFTLQSAAAVNKMDEIAMLDGLSSLVDKSLVQADEGEGETRYRLLDSTRQYAREKLSEAGEEDGVARAHAHAFLMWAQQLDAAWETTSEPVWFAQAVAEMENFRVALSWAFGERGDVLLAQRMAGVMRGWYAFRAAQGRRWVQIARQRATAQTPTAVLAALELAEARLALWFHEYKAALDPSERALARFRELGDARGVTSAQLHLARAKMALGDVDGGEDLAIAGLEAARSLGRRRTAMFALQLLGIARWRAADFAAAQQRFSEALTVARAISADREIASIMGINLAEVEFHAGNPVAALQAARDACSLDSAFTDARVVTNARYNMAAYLIALSRYDEARDAAREAIADARDAEMSVGLVWALQHLAAIAALRPLCDEPVIEARERAARILGYVDARLTALQASREYTEQQEYDAMITALRDALGEHQLSSLMAEGSTWSEDQTVTEAMLV